LESGRTYEFKAFTRHREGGELTGGTLQGLFTVDGGIETFDTSQVFSVSITDIDESLEGNTVTVTVEVENSLDEEDTQDVELDVDGLDTEGLSEQVTLDSGQSTVESFEVETGTDDSDTYTANVSSEDDFDIEEFKVHSLEPPILESPENDADDVGLDSSLKVEANSTKDDLEMDIFFEINDSGEDLEPVGSIQDVETNSIAELDFDDFEDFVLQGDTEYEWRAVASEDGLNEASDMRRFETVSRPEVVSQIPEDGASGVEPSPDIGVKFDEDVDVSESSLNVEFYQANHEKINDHDQSDLEFGDRWVNLSDSGLDSAGGIAWYAVVEEDGVEFNSTVHGENPREWEFFISEIEGVDFEVDVGDETNMNVDADLGEEEIVLRPDFEGVGSGFEGTIGIDIDEASGEESNDTVVVGAGVEAQFDISESSDFDLDRNEVYNYDIFYKEDEVIDDFTQEGSFSTYVAELEWEDGSPEATEKFNIYDNDSGILIGSVPQQDSVNVEVANEALWDEESSYVVRAENILGEEKCAYF